MRATIRWAILAWLIPCLILTAACALDEPQRVALLQYFTQELTAGRITQAQFEALQAALAGGQDWIASLIEVGMSVAGALLGVRLWRGGINSRNGVVTVLPGGQTPVRGPVVPPNTPGSVGD